MSIITKKFTSDRAFKDFVKTNPLVLNDTLRPIATSKNGKIYYFIDTEVDRDLGTRIILDDIKPYYYKNTSKNQILSFMIPGVAGSGKSYFAGELLDQLTDLENKPIFVFAINDQDDSLDKKRKKKMPIRIPWEDEDLYSSGIADFENTYLVFDDIEQLKNKAITNFTKDLRDLSLTAGRKLNIDVISILHDLKDKSARQVLKESRYHVLFPKSGRCTTNDYLDKKLGLYKPIRDKILNLKTRVLIIHSFYPRYIVAEKTIMLLD